MVDADKFTVARDAMLAEIEKIKSLSVSSDEVQKAIKQFISATLATRKTMEGQANDLGGSWLAANNLTFSERYLAAVKHVNHADVQRVAREYLSAENRTLYALLPNGTTPKQSAEVETNVDSPIQKFELPNGLRLLVKENHRLPFVEFRAAFQGGVLAETADNNGITQLLAKMLLKGTKTRDAEKIATEIESVGGHLDSYGGNNSFGVTAEVLSTDFATGLDLLADVLLHPIFPADPLEREREVQIATIASQKDNLLKSASNAMRRTLFGNTGYGLDTLGTEETVTKLKAADLKSFHQKLVSPKNCVLAIFGDVKALEVKTAVQKAFGSWRGTPGTAPASASPSNSQHAGSETGVPLRVEEIRDKKQAVIVIGFAGTTMHDDDRYALDLLQEACSDLARACFCACAKNWVWHITSARNIFLDLRPAISPSTPARNRPRPGWLNKSFLWKRNCCVPKA